MGNPPSAFEFSMLRISDLRVSYMLKQNSISFFCIACLIFHKPQQEMKKVFSLIFVIGVHEILESCRNSELSIFELKFNWL